MKNNIIIILVCLIFLSSCGKKGNPEYQASDTNIINNNL